MKNSVIDRLLLSGAGKDVTEYARSIGYSDARRVVVVDGKVVTHRSRNWHDFCAIFREPK